MYDCILNQNVQPKFHKLTVFLIRHQWCIYQATVHTINLDVLYQIDFLKKRRNAILSQKKSIYLLLAKMRKI
jgi:hypothetical protein